MRKSLKNIHLIVIQILKMISSQKRDAHFTFNMHLNPLLSLVVDSEWRKDSFKDINIYIPDNAKNGFNLEGQDTAEVYSKFANDKSKEWNDISVFQLLGAFSDIRDIEKRDK